MPEITTDNPAQFILQEKLVAILRNVEETKLLKIIEVFRDSGIKVAEVTLNTPGALPILAKITAKFGKDMLLGAGTVTSSQDVHKAVESGAKFIVMPTMIPEVIRTAKALNVAVMPGAFSPTEIQQAYLLGADVIKVFPAGSLGSAYFREIKGPMPEIPLAAVGGITLENGQAYLEAGAKVLGVGSALTPRDILAKEDWSKLAELAKRFKQLVSR
ncbi:bifunctional 4-hydroxy-2-oxoglutarate aldolase/2-dehydro-3-deoxy-phosphogluconate aldolase [Paradesulfitobacterium aromaticivorans]